MHTLSILDQTGDTTVTWDPTDEKSVEEVRRTFDSMIAKGFQAFKIGTDRPGQPKTGGVIRTFEPDAETIVMRGQFVGG